MVYSIYYTIVHSRSAPSPALFGDMATLPPPHPHFQVQDRVVKCHESHRYVHPCEINSQSLEIGIWKIHCVFFFLYIYLYKNPSI